MLTLLLAVALQDAPEDLVRKLGAEDYAEREKAGEKLRKLGKDAEGALRKGLESEDPEVRTRSKALLEELAPPSAKKPAAPRPSPFAPGFRGSSVSVRSANGDSTYVITPGDGSATLTFRTSASGEVKLEAVEGGKTRTAEAASLAAFLKEHKELAAKYGISAEGIDYAGARVSFQGGRIAPFRFNFKRRGGWPFLEPEEERAPEPKTPAFEPLSEALRTQLGLAEGQGVLVSRDDAAPGLRRHDVLLEIDGHPLGSPAEAARLAPSATSFALLRKGKREIVRTAPRKDF